MHDKEFIKVVQRNLWSRGYRVQTFSDTNLGFDLLVEGKFRVRVKANEKRVSTEGVDVIAGVEEGKGAFKGKFRIVYHTNEGTHLSPSHVFGLPMSKDKTYGKKEGKEGRKKGGKKAATEGGKA